jgi:transposase
VKKHIVKLTHEERAALGQVAGGKQNIAAWKVVRAKVLLQCDHGDFGPKWPDERLAAVFDLSVRCIEKWRRRAVEEGPLAVLQRKPRRTPPVPAKLDGAGEVQLANLACSAPPQGRLRWTLRLLAERLVELGVVASISRETVRQVLRKHGVDLGKPCSIRRSGFPA